MPLYRSVTRVPVFHSRLTAVTADTVSLTCEIKAGPCQSFCWDLLDQAGATEWVQTIPQQRKISHVICLQIAVLSRGTHDGTCRVGSDGLTEGLQEDKECLLILRSSKCLKTNLHGSNNIWKITLLFLWLFKTSQKSSKQSPVHFENRGSLCL